MRNPLFSIVIPTLNEEKDIGDILKSIQCQNYKNKEIIVVDGGSFDDTVKIAKKYSKKVYVLPKAGVTKSRNYGAKMSKGEILQFMDADAVLLDNDYMNRVIAAFNMYNVDVVVNRTDAYPPKTLIARAYKIHRRVDWETKQRGVVMNAGPPNISFTCYKRKFFWKIGAYDESLIGNDEIELSKRAQKYGAKTIFLPDIVIYHKDPYTLDQVKKQVRWYARVLKKHENFGKKIMVLGYYALFPMYFATMIFAIASNILYLVLALMFPLFYLAYISRDIFAIFILLPLNLYKAFYFFWYYIKYK